MSLYTLTVCTAAIAFFFVVVVNYGVYTEDYECTGSEQINSPNVGSTSKPAKAFLRLNYYRWFIFWAWGSSQGNVHYEGDGIFQYFEKLEKTSTGVFIYQRNYTSTVNDENSVVLRGMFSSLSGSLKLAKPPYFFDGQCARKI